MRTRKGQKKKKQIKSNQNGEKVVREHFGKFAADDLFIFPLRQGRKKKLGSRMKWNGMLEVSDFIFSFKTTTTTTTKQLSKTNEQTKSEICSNKYKSVYKQKKKRKKWKAVKRNPQKL
ncbi:hypothetical protein DPX39_010022200 [Trypanosoma brucei equiperdum]|uniref:Uncharacterized protein n=1 Tax=Trypanosoma brucei equiperdum TaxID=630700 RepID=A0A3L6LCH9_9TRYP|nr:hypothetical protein DPX39_010022200 [Trypanosoma brucei equiperdum]